MSVSTTTNKTNNSKSHSPLSNESILLLFSVVVEGYDSVELPMLACDIFVLLNIVFNNWS